MNDGEVRKESVRIQQEMGGAKRRSRAALYADLIVGRPGWGALIGHELVMLISSWIPGALGLLLRSCLYPLLLGRCGRRVSFGTGVVLRHPHKIEIGDHVIIDDNCLLDAKGNNNEGIRIGSGTFIGRNSILSCKNGDIVLGENVNIGFNCEVFSGSRVRVGDNTLMAAYSYLVGGDHDADDVAATVTEQGSSSRGIDVGDGCWIGAGVKVLDGHRIGQRAILGAGAVVTRDIPAYAVAAGVPARVIRDRRSAPAGSVA
ncbi:MAG: hypothetical protein A2498_11635 [Lentisphaerae bacterium RIFOXYC12_FULL_60_16]|nr:MAG: hypothetical protein A2498_11635 [Lentisphaerae bacterium RIFOXYC12_FULL_60_16]OGV70305.1 MAG: hypothetical protein A2269_02490 [Lentisphaerae bacterium RIFOXYA12_FULL_60_10]OGV85880.1 MAG: hypothetical protein A2340_11405 [Lentisphaerae bacterium RIFOXYB12_FULL_60_10]